MQDLKVIGVSTSDKKISSKKKTSDKKIETL